MHVEHWGRWASTCDEDLKGKGHFIGGRRTEDKQCGTLDYQRQRRAWEQVKILQH